MPRELPILVLTAGDEKQLANAKLAFECGYSLEDISELLHFDERQLTYLSLCFEWEEARSKRATIQKMQLAERTREVATELLVKTRSQLVDVSSEMSPSQALKNLAAVLSQVNSLTNDAKKADEANASRNPLLTSGLTVVVQQNNQTNQ